MPLTGVFSIVVGGHLHRLPRPSKLLPIPDRALIPIRFPARRPSALLLFFPCSGLCSSIPDFLSHGFSPNTRLVWDDSPPEGPSPSRFPHLGLHPSCTFRNIYVQTLPLLPSTDHSQAPSFSPSRVGIILRIDPDVLITFFRIHQM